MIVEEIGEVVEALVGKVQSDPKAADKAMRKSITTIEKQMNDLVKGLEEYAPLHPPSTKKDTSKPVAREPVVNLNSITNLDIWLQNKDNLYIGRKNSTHKLPASKWLNPFHIE